MLGKVECLWLSFRNEWGGCLWPIVWFVRAHLLIIFVKVNSTMFRP